LLPTNWRAWLLAAQFDAFGARLYESRDKSTSVQILWWGTFAAVSVDQALADPVLLHDLMPLWVVRLIETGQGTEWELHRAPSEIAEPMAALLAQIADRTGPIADFSYSPVFTRHIDLAREQVTAGDLDAAWDTVHSALPTWTPMSPNHLAPLGLYYDKDLRRLLTPPPPVAAPGILLPASGHAVVTISPMAQPSKPQDTASVSRLSDRKQYSYRTLDILTTPYSPHE
jgi:hypothetical protein